MKTKWNAPFIFIAIGLLLPWVGSPARAAESARAFSIFKPGDSAYVNMARQHVFMVDPDGTFMDPATKWKWAPKKSAITETESLEAISNGICYWLSHQKVDAPQPRVVVFVHGGLNSYDDTRNRLTNSDLMLALAASNCYPVFISWDSSLLSAYWQHLIEIRQGEKHRVIAKLTLPGVFISDLAVGVARLPVTLAGRYYNDYRTTEPPDKSWLARLTGDQTTVQWEGFEQLIHANLPDTYHPPQPELYKRSWTERYVYLTEYVLTQPTKIATLPIIDGLGTEAWDMMTRRTRTMFEPPDTYEIRKGLLHKWGTQVTNASNFMSVSNWLKGGDGGMYAFADAVQGWSQNPAVFYPTLTTNDLDFEFYGHSMGTMVLNELFWSHPGIRAKSIVYLAAACSVSDFEGSILPYLETNSETQFYSVSLHRMREREEYGLYSMGVKFPVLRDLIVRGSLLNWIDDIFEKPDTIPDRTLGAWENVTRSLPDVPDQLQSKVHFRGCDIEILPIMSKLCGTYEPQVHGDFPQAIFWSTNFYWPVGTNQLPLLKKPVTWGAQK